jgi:CheY-like chemotaxis protein
VFTGLKGFPRRGYSPPVTLSKRILVIEDDADVRDALAEALSDAGLRVDVAVDGMEGLARLRSGARPAVILLDLRMPRLGGEEFLRVMRADPRYEHVPVITMTAGVDPTNGHDVLAHLHKPFDLDDLLQIVLSLTEASAA